MGIGFSPLIPLYRVQPNPDERFQRFGVNGSQLYGKPILQLGSSAPTPHEKKTSEALETKGQVTTYSASAKATGPSSEASKGQKLDLKA